jgi:hypothetical protein
MPAEAVARMGGLSVAAAAQPAGRRSAPQRQNKLGCEEFRKV